jgi:transcriptional regulator with XRE-family HTH domain
VLATELRKSRLAAGLTQEELAAKANLSREYINYLERGKREPTVAVFVRLCKAMKVHPPDLLERVLKAVK